MPPVLSGPLLPWGYLPATWLGRETSYVLGTESANVVHAVLTHVTSELLTITPERQPRATLSRNLALQGQALPWSRDPPVLRTGGWNGCWVMRVVQMVRCRSARWGTIDHGAEWMPGCGAMDRAWPIVVHLSPPHKGVRYLRVTAG